MPLSVATFLRQRSHIVHTIKQSTFEGEPDEVIAQLGDQISREHQQSVMLVTWNHIHFKNLISRRPQHNNLRFRLLGRLSMTCGKIGALKRLAETIDDIEREHALCQTRSDKRCIMTIGAREFVVER